MEKMVKPMCAQNYDWWKYLTKSIPQSSNGTSEQNFQKNVCDKTSVQIFFLLLPADFSLSYVC